MISTTDKNLNEVLIEIAGLLVAQKVPCINLWDGFTEATPECAYGNDLGHHCAVGFLIDPSNEAAMSYIGDVSELLEDVDLGEERTFLEDNVEILGLLQQLHDSNSKDERGKLLARITQDPEVIEAFLPWVKLGEELSSHRGIKETFQNI